MPDTFGEIEIPLAPPAEGETVADPCLVVVLGYLKALLNANLGAAWNAVAPGKLPVNGIFAVDPKKRGFNERDLPALYITRQQPNAPPEWMAADWYVTNDMLRLTWVFPPEPQTKQMLRGTFGNGIVKAIATAIERERDACFVLAGDPDPTAATLVTISDAIKLAVATSTSPQSYSGAQLNGSIGALPISPPRAGVVTASGDPAAFAGGVTVTFAGTNVLGLTTSLPVVVNALGAFSTPNALASVTSIAVTAAANTGGQLSFGLGPYQGRGTVVRDFTQFWQWFVHTWRLSTLTIEMNDARTTRAKDISGYETVEVDITVREKLTQDLTDLTRFSALTGLDVSYLLSDGSVSETQSLPDNSGD